MPAKGAKAAMAALAGKASDGDTGFGSREPMHPPTSLDFL
jgi:hypothetical protein